MPGNKRNTEIILHQNHKRLLSITNTFLDIFRMSGKMESIRLYSMFIYRSSHQDIYTAVTIISQGSFQCVKCSLAGFSSRLSQFNLKFLCRTVQYIQSSVLYFLGRINNTEIGGYIHRLTMVCSHLRRTINYRRTQFHHLRFSKGLQYYLIPYTVDVTVGDSHSYFTSFHVLYLYVYIFIL